MTIELIMAGDYRVLVHYLESVTEDEIVIFKLKFEHSLILTENGDDAHVLILIRTVYDSVDEAVRYIVVLGLFWVSDVVRLEMQPVAAEVKHANVFAFLQFTHFKSELRYLFWEVAQTLQSLLLLFLLIHFLRADLHLFY